MRKPLTKLLTLTLSLALALTAMVSVAFAADGVASVDDTSYDTLQEAINAANGKTVVLTAPVTESVTIPTGSTVTLDLAGQTLTGGANDAIYVSSGASLTVTDSVGGGKVQAASGGYAAVFNNGTAILSGGTYTRSAAQWYTIVNHAAMTINAGVTVNTTVDTTSSLVENGYSSYSGSNERNNYVAGTNSAAPSLTINGGSFTSAGYNTVKNDEGGVLSIVGGTFTCPHANGAVIQNWNVATISGGTFTATGNAAAVISNGTWGSAAKGEVTIENGTFIVDDAAVNTMLFSSGDGSADGGSVTISGGDYTGQFSSSLMDSYYTTTISAGTFTSAAAADYAADGQTAASLTSGTDTKYYIGSSENVAATLADKAAEGDAIDVQQGVLSLSGLVDGITVTNSGDESVTVNNQPVTDNTVVTHTHTPTATAAKAASCTEPGNIAYWYCNSCQKYFRDEALTQEISLADTVAAATGHSAKAVPAKAPTAAEPGNIAYWYCETCGKYFSDEALTQEIAPASTVLPVTGTTEPPQQDDSNTGSGTSVSSPKTGDSASVVLWVSVMLFAVGGAAGMAIYFKKRA